MLGLSFLLMLTSMIQDVPELRARHPGQPEQTGLTYEANCGRNRLRIANYGYSWPESRSPRVLLNGRRLTGVMAIQLERDLSNKRAVYRLSALCDVRARELQLIVYRGRAASGGVEYQVGRAGFVNGALTFYRPLEPTNETTFWFE